MSVDAFLCLLRFGNLCPAGLLEHDCRQCRRPFAQSEASKYCPLGVFEADSQLVDIDIAGLKKCRCQRPCGQPRISKFTGQVLAAVEGL